MSVQLQFAQLPNLPLQLGRGALVRRAARADVTVPRIEAVVRDVRTPESRLAAYRKVCGLPDDGAMPATWPQVLAMPLHTAMLAHDAFPLPLLGIVHVSNVIEERRRIGPGEPLDLHCHLEGSREAKSGVEFDIHTEARIDGEVAWTSVTCVLVKLKQPGRKREERHGEFPGEPPGAVRSVVWRLPEHLGRRYARVAGDWNPIHVHSLLAKPFGFQRAIIHGMWTFARSLGEASDLLPEVPRRLSVSFKRPVLLPSRVSFSVHQRDGEALGFAVRGGDGSVVHLTGRAEALR